MHLKQIGNLCSGRIINVSGWRDEDKAGGHYRDYFPAAISYDISNYPGERGLLDGAANSIPLDLEAPLTPDLASAFDVVLAHTVLEHIPEVEVAFSNLARLTRDILIVIVPFSQGEHFIEGSFGDFWRFTPMGLERLFTKNGLTVIFSNNNDNPVFPIYLLMVGSKKPLSNIQINKLNGSTKSRLGYLR